MGQKVNAVGLRIGINRGWEANWYASKKDYATFLGEDIAIRNFLEPKLKEALLSHIDIARVKTDSEYKVTVSLYVARPGVVMGQDGANTKLLNDGLKKIVKSGNPHLEVVEVKNPDVDATLIGKWIASELENRQSFRSTQKKAIQRMRKAGASGGGAEIARREGYKEGVVTLETLRADIDFAAVSAATAYGRIGVKVWCCRGTNKVGIAAAEEKKAPKAEGGNKNAPTK